MFQSSEGTKNYRKGGTWPAQGEEPASLDPRVVGLSPTLSLEPTYKAQHSKTKHYGKKTLSPGLTCSPRKWLVFSLSCKAAKGLFTWVFIPFGAISNIKYTFFTWNFLLEPIEVLEMVPCVCDVWLVLLDSYCTVFWVGAPILVPALRRRLPS